MCNYSIDNISNPTRFVRTACIFDKRSSFIRRNRRLILANAVKIQYVLVWAINDDIIFVCCMPRGLASPLKYSLNRFFAFTRFGWTLSSYYLLLDVPLTRKKNKIDQLSKVFNRTQGKTFQCVINYFIIISCFTRNIDIART